jgi:DNA-binding MarR family transcriptional regulator
MDTDKLIATGLTPLQAEAYALLIEKGQTSPPQAAENLKISRTNAYKLLDKLVELKLASKHENGKKLVYSADNPLALTNVTAQYRAEATAREEAASSIMQDLLARYYEHADKPTTTVVTGQKEVARLYRKQLSQREDVYFLHTPADVPMMSFDTMHEIRIIPAQHGNQRKAIMGAPENGTINHRNHSRSNLEITWAKKGLYTAPVEWSVTNSSLLIVIYGAEPHAILIADKLVAGAFMQVWSLMNLLLQQQPTHKEIVKQA